MTTRHSLKREERKRVINKFPFQDSIGMPMFFFLLSSKAQWCSDEKTICFCLCYFYCRILLFLVNFMLFHSLSFSLFLFSKALMHCLFLLFLFLEKNKLLEGSFWELFLSTRRWIHAHDFKFLPRRFFSSFTRFSESLTIK